MDFPHGASTSTLDGAAVSQTLRRNEHALAEAVTDAFLVRHPDWVARYGDRARTAGIEDARFHVQFLAAALERGSIAAFRDYVQWATRVLGARGIDPAFLWENLQQIQDTTTPYLTEVGRPLVAHFIESAKRADVADHATTADGPLGLTRRLFVQAIVIGERKAALNIARQALGDGAPVLDLYADVFQDALYEVGRLWETNAITVAQEHMATAVTQYVMAHIFGSIESVAPTRGTAIMTGVPGELHHVGALMVSDMLEAQGWQIQFLGSNLPITSILTTIRDAKPRLLCISVTMPFNLHHARHLIIEAKLADPLVRVVVGGAAFRFDGWRDIGADDYAIDLRSAISLLCGEAA
jgi:MerR family transcriptional regulator, light-induced transcriptional regulator